MAHEHLQRPDLATPILGQYLTTGALTLFLGAGASTSAGLPSWPVLIQRLHEAAGLAVPDVDGSTSADELQRLADNVQRQCADQSQFVALLGECLYTDVVLSEKQLFDPLLIAIGAMLVGSRRGSVQRVVTLNFDSVLEWYLTLCGLVPRVVLQPPTLEGGEDVRVYHPHGYVGHPDLAPRRDSDFVILGLQKINERIGQSGDPWFELLRHILRTSVCLFVGMSVRTFRDRALAPLLANIGPEVGPSRPLGCWLVADEDDHEGDVAGEMLAVNVVPIRLARADIPGFLLGICQAASAGVEV